MNRPLIFPIRMSLIVWHCNQDTLIVILSKSTAATPHPESTDLDPTPPDAAPPSDPPLKQEEQQPELPDPFQLDDPDDPVSDEEEAEDEESRTPFGTSSEVTIGPSVMEVSLHALPPELRPTPFTPAPTDLEAAKPQPPLPEDDVDKDSDDTPVLYLPGLVVPGLFLPIPNVCAWLFRSC